MLSGTRLTKVQMATRPYHVCPEVWTKKGKASQNREKQEWKNEEPKFDNARGLRGIYFTDPDDQDCNETLKHARRKKERLVVAAMPCKRKAQTNTLRWLQSRKSHLKSFQNDLWLFCGSPWIQKTTSGIFSTYKTQRSHGRQRRYLDDSLQFASHIYSFAPSDEDSECKKTAVDKEWKKLETIPGWQLEKVKSAKRQKESPLCYTDGHMSSHERGVRTKITKKYKGRVVLRGDIVKDDSGAYPVFTELGSSASQMTAAKVMGGC